MQFQQPVHSVNMFMVLVQYLLDALCIYWYSIYWNFLKIKKYESVIEV